MIIPRPRQKTFVARCHAALNKYGNTLGVANTGFGKTIALSMITGERINGNKKALILAHRDELTRQNSEKFKLVNPKVPISFFNSDSKSWRGRTVFSMIQTLSNEQHLATMPEFDLLVIDEAHHAASDTYRRVIGRALEKNSKCEILGVTATPERSDRRGLRHTFSNVADVVTITEMVRAGHLVPPRAMVIDIGTQNQLEQVKKTANDYDQAEVEAIQNTTYNNNQIVAKWLELAQDRPTVAFSSTIDHAETVRDAFRDGGVDAEAVHGQMGIKRRREILAAFDRGEIPVLVNPMILTEGWDCLDMETEVLTPQGWEKYDGMKNRSHVLSYNLDSGQIEKTLFENLFKRPVRQGEKMFRLKSQHYDIRTSEGHIFPIKYRNNGKLSKTWLSKTGYDLSDRKSAFSVPLSASDSNRMDSPVSDDRLRLAAWTYTDGYINKKEQVFIYQSKKPETAEIRRLLTACNIRFSEYLRKAKTAWGDSATTTFSLLHGWGYDKQIDRAPVPKKTMRLAPMLSELSRRQFRIFWTELLKGDGHIQKKKAGWFYTPSKAFVDDLMALAVQVGFACSCSETRTKKGRPFYRVSCRDRQFITTDPQDDRASKPSLENPRPGEFVWCLTNKNSTLITRRRGKVAIIGNCQICSCVVLLRIASHKSTVIQMVGRGLRKVDHNIYPGVSKRDCLVLDFGISLLTHGDLNSTVVLKDDGKHGDPSDDAQKKTCPSCKSELPIQTRECPLCGFEFRVELDETGFYDEAQELRLIEIDLINNSPFRWVSLWNTDRILVANGFEAWACVCSKNDDDWFSIAGKGMEVKILGVSNRIGAIASADDFMRKNESARNSRKAAVWHTQPASEKQMTWLGKFGMCQILSRVEAGAYLTFFFNKRKIEQFLSV